MLVSRVILIYEGYIFRALSKHAHHRLAILPSNFTSIARHSANHSHQPQTFIKNDGEALLEKRRMSGEGLNT